MMSIKGYKSQQALQQKLSGFTEDQSIDRQRYVTVQEMNGHRHALDVLIHGAYQIGGTLTVASGSNIRVIRCVSHGALVNDIIRLSNGTEFAALSVPDADTIVTSTELLVDPTADTFTVWRHVTPSYTNTGALNVAVVPDPNAATSANQVLEIAALDSIANRTFVQTLFFNYASTSVSSAAWVQLIASTSDTIKHLTLFESGGYAMEIGIGAAASEVRLFVVPPGGFNGELPFPIPSGSRVSIRCLEVVTVSTGLIVANFLK